MGSFNLLRQVGNIGLQLPTDVEIRRSQHANNNLRLQPSRNARYLVTCILTTHRRPSGRVIAR